MIFIAAIFFIIILLFVNTLVKGKDRIKFFSRGKTLSTMEKRRVAKRWYEIEELVNIQGISTSNQAVIKADKLFNSVLKKMAFPGKTVGDRLKAAKDRFSSYEIYDTAWKAHKMRNAVVHQENFDLNKKAAKSTLRAFKRVLRDLGAL